MTSLVRPDRLVSLYSFSSNFQDLCFIYFCKSRLRLNSVDFLDLFITGGIADQFGSGVPRFVSGMSGIELVWEVMERSDLERELPEWEAAYDCSPEYWCGWILAYYQWYTGRSFWNIRKSQRTLAEKSGVALRMIQQYEQRAKDINKAGGMNRVALAETLGCMQGGGFVRDKD